LGSRFDLTMRVDLGGAAVSEVEMASLIRQLAWGETPIGPAEAWPQCLKTIVDIITSSPLAMIVLWGPSLVQIYNAAYAKILAAKHPSALGQPTRECWPEVWEFNAPIYKAVRRGEVRAFPKQPLTIERNGVAEEAWFDLTYSPVRDEAREVAGVLVTVVETTHQVRLDALTQAAADQGEHLRALFQQAPGFIALMKGPDHVFEFANPAYMRLVGGRPVIGLAVREVISEAEGHDFFALLDGVYDTGVPYRGFAMPIHLEGDLEPSFLDFVYAPAFGPDGTITGVFLEGHEVTERVRADERRTLMVAELNHRITNTLAMVQAIARMTGKSTDSVPAFVAAFTVRIDAMAKTHGLLTETAWRPVKVREVLTLELAPYLGDHGQVALACDDLAIDADTALSLSLIVHELLTNASKYGALASPAGRLSLRCDRTVEGATMTWVERTPTPVIDIGRRGFGTTLIARLAKSLGGDAELGLQPTGMRAVVRFQRAQTRVASG
jgi:two-component sensor histidine kinase